MIHDQTIKHKPAKFANQALLKSHAALPARAMPEKCDKTVTQKLVWVQKKTSERHLHLSSA